LCKFNEGVDKIDSLFCGLCREFSFFVAIREELYYHFKEWRNLQQSKCFLDTELLFSENNSR